MKSIARTKHRNQVWFYLYYIALMLILTSWRSTTDAPALPLRLGFLVAVVMPLFLSKETWLPAVITLFKTFTEYGFAYSYMPTMYYFYIAIVFVGLFLLYKKNHVEVPPVMITLLLFVFVVDLLHGSLLRNSHYSIFIILAFCLFTDRYDDGATEKMELAFAVCTLVLSVFFFVMRDQFTRSYMHTVDLERMGWIDPNYFGMVLGMGAISSILALYRRENWKRYEKVVYIATIGISAIVLILNASRGALLSTVLAASVAIMFSKAKMFYKLAIVLAIVGVAMLALRSGYFDLLVYRIQNDELGGSGRVNIWMAKLGAFSREGIIQWVLGVGGEGMGFEGSDHYVSSHNDYIAFLVGYGIVGLCLFVSVVLYPLRSVTRGMKINGWFYVLVPTVYVMTNALTLEPLNQGRLPYWCFYYYMIILASELKQKAVWS